MEKGQVEEWYTTVFNMQRKKLKINGHCIEYEQKLNQIPQYRGGILEFLDLNAKTVDGCCELVGDDKREEALLCYIDFLRYWFFLREDQKWFHPTTKILPNQSPVKELAKIMGYLLCCGADLRDVLKYFGMFDDCGEVLGELFIIAGESIVTAFKKDEDKSWREFVLIGAKWVLVCKPNDAMMNLEYVQTIFRLYNIEGLLA
ncbi:hypothetical protein EIN_405060 [Entamoeba invadens IP1]|uniref:Uncharacterized protein n=1 Tax=Entamoeba invadens IP1 TaxID=370355 RepID=A0A0A1U6R7_ENTIV|nr:hypothetical protein EIN_405060 [Entamoeba invadens IP1]ELP90092.1 hypothetical protein EIN_405060 [Entamoeba invadens IP1]|eukprot:XP_004256863.1 hypothetical protein EIN_405060 [Entamoeba invadens IP1]